MVDGEERWYFEGNTWKKTSKEMPPWTYTIDDEEFLWYLEGNTWKKTSEYTGPWRYMEDGVVATSEPLKDQIGIILIFLTTLLIFVMMLEMLNFPVIIDIFIILIITVLVLIGLGVSLFEMGHRLAIKAQMYKAGFSNKKKYGEYTIKEVAKKRKAADDIRKAYAEKRIAEEELAEKKRIAEEEKLRIEKERIENNYKISAFKKKNFQSEHRLPSNIQKERTWNENTGKCTICIKNNSEKKHHPENRQTLSFWWVIAPKLEVILLCEPCAIELGIHENKPDSNSNRTVTKEVRDSVWRRDEGKCTQCGSNKKLELDHIIPHSKGGSNSYRNIQLLCQECNREKSDSIG